MTGAQRNKRGADSMRTVKPKGPTAAELVEAMREAGAAFIFTECGSLLVRGLHSLPAEMTARFFDSEPRAIVAAVREKAPVEQYKQAA